MYNYEKERPAIFTKEGVKMQLEIRDRIRNLCKTAGCCTLGKAMGAGDSFTQLACFDFLNEIGDISFADLDSLPRQKQVIFWNREL